MERLAVLGGAVLLHVAVRSFRIRRLVVGHGIDLEDHVAGMVDRRKPDMSRLRAAAELHHAAGQSHVIRLAVGSVAAHILVAPLREVGRGIALVARHARRIVDGVLAGAAAQNDLRRVVRNTGIDVRSVGARNGLCAVGEVLEIGEEQPARTVGSGVGRNVDTHPLRVEILVEIILDNAAAHLDAILRAGVQTGIYEAHMLVARKGEEVVIFERASLDNVARSILQAEVHEIGRTQLLLGQRLLVVRPLDDGIAVSLLVKLDRRSRQRVYLHTALGYRLDSDSLRVPLLVGRVDRRKRDIVCRTLLQARNLQRIGRSIDALHEVGLRGCGNRQTIVVSTLDLVPRERYGRTLDRSREVLRSVERLGALDDRSRSHDLDVVEEEASAAVGGLRRPLERRSARSALHSEGKRSPLGALPAAVDLRSHAAVAHKLAGTNHLEENGLSRTCPHGRIERHDYILRRRQRRHLTHGRSLYPAVVRAGTHLEVTRMLVAAAARPADQIACVVVVLICLRRVGRSCVIALEGILHAVGRGRAGSIARRGRPVDTLGNIYLSPPRDVAGQIVHLVGTVQQLVEAEAPNEVIVHDARIERTIVNDLAVDSHFERYLQRSHILSRTGQRQGQLTVALLLDSGRPRRLDSQTGRDARQNGLDNDALAADSL